MHEWIVAAAGLLVTIVGVWVRLNSKQAEHTTQIADLRKDVDAEQKRGDDMIPRLVRMETLLGLIYQKMEVREKE